LAAASRGRVAVLWQGAPLSDDTSLAHSGVRNGARLKVQPLQVPVTVRLPGLDLANDRGAAPETSSHGSGGSGGHSTVQVWVDPERGSVADVRAALVHGDAPAGKARSPGSRKQAPSPSPASPPAGGPLAGASGNWWLEDAEGRRLEDNALLPLDVLADAAASADSAAAAAAVSLGPASAAATARLPAHAGGAAAAARAGAAEVHHLRVGFGTFRLFVATPTRATVEVEVGCLASMASLKLAVAAATGVPPGEQRLSLVGSGDALGGRFASLDAVPPHARCTSVPGLRDGETLELELAPDDDGDGDDLGRRSVRPPHPLLADLHGRSGCSAPSGPRQWHFNPGAPVRAAAAGPGDGGWAPGMFECAGCGHGLTAAGVDACLKDWGLVGFPRFLAAYAREWRGARPAVAPLHTAHPTLDDVLGLFLFVTGRQVSENKAPLSPRNSSECV
jgi:hypothetical protein